MKHTVQALQGASLALPTTPGREATIVMGITRLFRSLPSFTVFLPAWLTYGAIKGHYNPQFTEPMLVWTVNLIQHAAGTQWKFVLDYIIYYYNAHQNAEPESWLDPNATLISQYIQTSMARIAYNAVTSSSPSNSFSSRHQGRTSAANMPSIESKAICINYNTKRCTYQNDFGQSCRRLHVCRSCRQSSHTERNCLSFKLVAKPATLLP